MLAASGTNRIVAVSARRQGERHTAPRKPRIPEIVVNRPQTVVPNDRTYSKVVFSVERRGSRTGNELLGMTTERRWMGNPHALPRLSTVQHECRQFPPRLWTIKENKRFSTVAPRSHRRLTNCRRFIASSFLPLKSSDIELC